MESHDGRQRVVFVLIDGLAHATAVRMLGFMGGMVESGEALQARVQSVLPSLSRPCYATIFTGLPPLVHGVWANDQAARLEVVSIFDLLARAGRTSAVAGYHWMSELFSRGPFDHVRDVEQDGNAEGITHGRFYFNDEYPDQHLFAQAERMRAERRPDLLVIHPMGCDHAGHRHGSSSREYAATAAQIDFLLAKFVPRWLADGYHVVVTADHGMDEQGFHGGPDDQVRITPLYMLGPSVKRGGATDDVLQQTSLAGLLCALLRLGHPETMGLPDARWRAEWLRDATVGMDEVTVSLT